MSNTEITIIVLTAILAVVGVVGNKMKQKVAKERERKSLDAELKRWRGLTEVQILAHLNEEYLALTQAITNLQNDIGTIHEVSGEIMKYELELQLIKSYIESDLVEDYRARKISELETIINLND